MKFLSFLVTVLFLSNLQAAEKKVPLIKINIAYSQTIINAQIGLIFENTNILKKNGFEASVKGMATGKELKMALIAGQADVILTSESNFVIVRSSQFEAYAISTLGSAGRLGLVVKNDGKLNKTSDLKGKKLGALFGTTVHQRALEWKNKIDAAGIELVSLGSIAALSAALEAGSVDACMMWDPFLEDSIRNKRVKLLGTSDFDLINVMSKSYLDKNPAVNERLNAAFLEAFEYLLNHKEEVNKMYGELVKISSATIDAASLINKNYTVKNKKEFDIKITQSFKENLEKISEFLSAEKVIPKIPEIKSYIK